MYSFNLQAEQVCDPKNGIWNGCCAAPEKATSRSPASSNRIKDTTGPSYNRSYRLTTHQSDACLGRLFACDRDRYH
jgi:hypothetical protein